MKPFFWVFLGTIFGFFSVAIGAFGAHGLKSKVSTDLMNTFETGVRYQMYHALALILLGLIANFFPSALLDWSGWFLVAGIVVFSGSLYLLVITGANAFGAITPFGGLCLMAGWFFLALRIYQV